MQKIVIDDVITTHRQPLAPWLTLMIVMGVFTFVFAYFRRFRGGRIALDVQHDLRTAIFRQLQRLDFARHDEMSTGQLVSRASSDVALIQGFLQFLPIGVANMLLFVVSLTVMFILSVPLALVMLAVAPLLLVTAMKLRTSVFPASWDAQQKAGDVANVVEEDVTGVRVVKGFGQEARELQRLADRSEAMFASRVRLVNIQARLQPAMQTIPAFGQVAVLALGGWLALHGHITYGTFFAFASYMFLIAPPVRQLAAILTVGQLARRGGRAHLRPPRLDPERAGQARTRSSCTWTGRRSVRPRHVRLHVDRTGVARLHPRGRGRRDGRARGRIGLGQVDGRPLAAPFYDVHSGSISIDGLDVRDVTLQSLRGSIGVVFEDSFLFSDSLTANIAFGRPTRPGRGRDRGARPRRRTSSSCSCRTATRPSVGEQGLTLSGGQRQRGGAGAGAALAIPRSCCSTTRRRRSTRGSKRRSTRRCAGSRAHARHCLIAHRRSTLSLADRIVVVDKGQVVDAGTNEELTARCQLYRLLLSGPGDDAEGIDAIEEQIVDDTRVDGITPAAWRGLEARRAAQRADHRSHPHDEPGRDAVRRSGRWRWRRWRGRRRGLGRALAPTPELLAQVDALEPADADPRVDVAC